MMMHEFLAEKEIFGVVPALLTCRSEKQRTSLQRCFRL